MRGTEKVKAGHNLNDLKRETRALKPRHKLLYWQKKKGVPEGRRREKTSSPQSLFTISPVFVFKAGGSGVFLADGLW